MVWYANIWLAKVISLYNNFDAIFNAVEQYLSILLKFDINQATITKVNNYFLD